MISRILEKVNESLAFLFGVGESGNAGSHLIADCMRKSAGKGVQGFGGEATKVHWEVLHMAPIQFFTKNVELRNGNDRRQAEVVGVYVFHPGLSAGCMIDNVIGAILIL